MGAWMFITRSVTFSGYLENDSLDGYIINETVSPNDFIIKTIPEGKYKIEVWDENDYLIEDTEFAFKLPVSDESNHNLYYFDLAINKIFSVLNVNALYEGNAFSEHMSTAMGTNANQLKIEETYEGNKGSR